MLFLFKSTPENKKRKHSEHFCRSKGPGGVTKSQQNLLYSEFISEVDLFHKQKLAQSTNYAKTCCVYKGEINLTLLREEPKSIFFSVNFSCFRFFISAGDFTCYGGMLWAGGYYSSSALHRPCPSPSQELSHRGRVFRQCQSRQRQPRAHNMCLS